MRQKEGRAETQDSETVLTKLTVTNLAADYIHYLELPGQKLFHCDMEE